MKMSERLFNEIAGIVARANERYAPGELERIHKALMAYVGVGEPVPRAELQDAKLIVPGLEARWWHDRDVYGKEREQLEAAFPAIRREMLSALESTTPGEYVERHLVQTGRWNALLIKRADRYPNESTCPETTAVIRSIPSVGYECFFSLLEPGTHIKPHVGGWNCRLTLHLALVVPPGCAIRVGRETREWEEGKTMLFDDSFEHEAWNHSGSRRAVLILDFWHPDLTPPEVSVLQEINVAFAREYEEANES
jgi:aspartate beta-hydroxylase